MRAENEALRRENRQLRAELIEMRRLAEESGRYQRLLGLRDATPAETIAARVIAIDASPYFRVARVEHRPRRGDGPARDAGADARRASSAASTASRARRSDIMLLVDPRSAIDVIVPRTGGRGILRGKSGENGYRCSIEYLARGEPAQGGRRGRHQRPRRRVPAQPRGRPRHRASSRAPSGLYQDVEVTPDVDFARLSEVLVVVAPPPAPDPDAALPPHARPRGLTVYQMRCGRRP